MYTTIFSGFKKTFVGFITNVIAYAGVSWAATGLGKKKIIHRVSHYDENTLWISCFSCLF